MSGSPFLPGSSSGAFPALPAPPHSTLGALLIGGLIAMALWGITCVQTYTYFTQKPRDRLNHRLLIALLCALDTFDSGLNVHMLYYYTVSNYYNPMAIMSKPVWSINIHIAATVSSILASGVSALLTLSLFDAKSVSNFFIRVLFALRFYKLSHGNVPVTAWILGVSTVDLVSGIVITVKAFALSSFLELDKIAPIMFLIFAAGTASDLSVAIAMCVLLSGARTGFRKTDSLIKSLIVYSINTGSIVAIDATLVMIFYIVMPHNFIFYGSYILMSKLYLNSYLAMLNAREDLKERIDEPVSISLSQISTRYPSKALPVINSEKVI